MLGGVALGCIPHGLGLSDGNEKRAQDLAKTGLAGTRRLPEFIEYHSQYDYMYAFKYHMNLLPAATVLAADPSPSPSTTTPTSAATTTTTYL